MVVARAVGDVRPILALHEAAEVATFVELIEELPSSIGEVFCWRGSWDEATATQEDVKGWVSAVHVAADHGISLTNLYGGFLSVLLTGLGLAGLNHGIGYSESRDVRRLGETGAPPTRYYVPAVHSFLTVPAAQPLIDHLPAAWACQCDVCSEVQEGGRPVVARLTPTQRKRHFLLARQQELQAVSEGLEDCLSDMRAIAEWLEENP